MNALKYGYIVAGCCIMAACHNNENKQTAVPAAPAKPVLQAPFRYHKFIEVAPGLDFDVFSWGRGPAGSAAYMILRSDSTGKKYTTTTGDVDGKLVDAFNTDLDTDGNPEIFVQSQTADSTGYDKIEVYEYNDDNARKLDFPKLTSKQKRGYHGGDNFEVKDNKLIRTYTIYDGDNANAKPTGEKRTLQYSFHSNSFSAQQISTDSTVTTAASGKTSSETATPKAEAPAQQTTEKHISRHSHHESRHETRRERRQDSRHHKTEERHRSSSSRHQESSKKRRRHRR